MGEIQLAARSLLKSPVFTFVAVLSLALGIGANTAMFTLVDQVLLRLLPVKNPQELVQFRLDGGRVGSQSGDGRHTFAHPQYLDFRDRNTVLSGLAGYRVENTGLTWGDRSEMVSVGLVSGNYFDVLGVLPHSGRLLSPSDDRFKNQHPVAVLQYDFWKNRFAGRTEIIGSKIQLNGAPFTVIGVAAPGFEGTDVGIPTKLWVPVMMKPTITTNWDALDDTRDAWFYLIGRLKPGVTIEQAQSSLRVTYSQRQQEELKGEMFQRFPDQKERFLKQVFTLIPAAKGQSSLRERAERPLVVLECLVGVVLLIACANVANLLLARAAARQKEIAVRTALGASRWQIMRQLLVEHSMLAVLGGAAGLAISVPLAAGLIRFIPVNPADLSLATTPDLRILLFTGGVTILTALIFGLTPALQASRVEPGATLKTEAGAVAGGHGHVRLRKTLVAFQVGLATVLLISAGLFARTLRNLHSVDLGFRTESVVMFGVRPATVYEDSRKIQVYRALLENLKAVPGVKAAGANRTRLLTGGRWDSTITIPGVPDKPGNTPWSFFNAVTPGYFEALGIPIVQGRDFTWSDWGTDRYKCLVNQKLVDDYLGGESPVGRMMAQGRGATPDMEIIGVFANTRYENVRGEIPRQTFVAMGAKQRIKFMHLMNVYVRVEGDPGAVMPLLRATVQRTDPNLIVSDMRTMDEQLNQRLTTERMLSHLSVGFALLATLLALVGMYGVLAFLVERRTKEIGIRMALGAERGSVIWLVLAEVALLIVVGMAAGIGAGLMGGRYVESQLFGVNARDPLVFGLSAFLLLWASLAAGLIPAWRAARIDPIRALRYE